MDAVSPGEHTVTLQPADNCSTDGPGTRTALVVAGELTPVTFAVNCVAVTGVVEVKTATGGEDIDFDGYGIGLGSYQQRRADAVDVVFYTGVSGGTHVLSIDDVAFNCAVSGGNEHVVQVSVGGTVRDTVRVVLNVTCTRMSLIAFTRATLADPFAAVVTTEGEHVHPLAQAYPGKGRVGSWSPDGQRLVIAASCDIDYGDYWWYYWWYYGCESMGIYTVDLISGHTVNVTTQIGDVFPSWSPDGSRIAFVRDSKLFVINADGKALTLLPLPTLALGVSYVAHPSWSPDGQRLAFTCARNSGSTDICIANSDGTGMALLTNDSPADSEPAWSPDGTQIAFASRRNALVDHVAIVNTDGTGFRQVAAGAAPSWSPDGAWLVFAGLGGAKGIWKVRADGSDLTQLTNGDDTDPVWRP